MIEKKYLTFDELAARWNCDKNDLHYLIANQDLVPSIVWQNAAMCYEMVPDADGAGFLSLSVVFDKDGINPLIKRLHGWIYLRIPKLTGVDGKYSFSYATSEPPAMGESAQLPCEWYRLIELASQNIPVDVEAEWLVNNAVFMMEVVKHCETSLHPGLSHTPSIEETADKNRQPKQPVNVSDNTLVATIAAMLASWPGGKLPSGKDLEKSAASVGVSISDDSIRKALNLAKESAPGLESA